GGLGVGGRGGGGHVTSLDMAGLSVTVTLLDEELEPLWVAPVDTPAFRRGVVRVEHAARRGPIEDTGRAALVPGSADSAAAAREVLHRLDRVVDALKGREDEFGSLDAVAGDGDHGQQMVLGAVGAASRGHDLVEARVGLGT